MAYDFGTIDALAIAAPSAFHETEEVIGGYNTTLLGTRRRYIKAVKKTWTLRYSIMTVTDYDNWRAIFDAYVPTTLQTSESYATFTITDSRFHVTSEQVHIDISNREVIPGTDLLSDVEIVLTQV